MFKPSPRLVSRPVRNIWFLGRLWHSVLLMCTELNHLTHLWFYLLRKRVTNRESRHPTVLKCHVELPVPACLKAHPQLHFQLAAPRKAVMKAVAKEHSDVTERLQTQTVNSTLWVACHHHQLPREYHSTWLSQPSAQLPTNTTANHTATHQLPAPTHYLSCTDLWRDGVAGNRDHSAQHIEVYLTDVQLRSGHVQITLCHQQWGKYKIKYPGRS